jgi:hypothetical protein
MPRAARAAFVFWGGPAFAPGWRPHAEAGAPLVREDLSEDLPVTDGITATIRASGLRFFVLVLAPRASAWARARMQQCPP